MDFPVSIGAYRYTASPDDPAILHLVRVPTRPGLRNVDQFRAARYELLATPFSKFEQEASRQLDAMFGPYGFDSSRDIQAITVNRWSHGYARSGIDANRPGLDAGKPAQRHRSPAVREDHDRQLGLRVVGGDSSGNRSSSSGGVRVACVV